MNINILFYAVLRRLLLAHLSYENELRIVAIVFHLQEKLYLYHSVLWQQYSDCNSYDHTLNACIIA